MKPVYDAVLIVSFGGPEHRDDVIPFLENVLRGRPVPRERLLAVAEHYYHFDGVSPINGQVRNLITALRAELESHQIDLPIYWGNRNWHPLLTDTVQQMAEHGKQHVLAFVTSAFSCYSGCRQYRENIWQAQRAAGGRVPRVDKIRVFYDHPLFVQTMIDRTREAVEQIESESRPSTRIVFTAHSIPQAMADASDYERQLQFCCAAIMQHFTDIPWKLVYQSRSGSPTQPWLEPDVGDYLRGLASQGDTVNVVIVPIGFVSDHMEVLFDLDTEAQTICQQMGLRVVRAATAGTHPKFVAMIRQLLEERLEGTARIGMDETANKRGLCTEMCCWPGRPDFVPHERTLLT